MKQEHVSVFGIYDSIAPIEQAITDLKLAGFRREDISIIVPSADGDSELGHVNSTKAPEGAVVGGTTGAAIGGVLGWLAGVGSIAIPGAGPFIAAGPIMGLLSGVGMGGTVGSVAGALAGLGVPEYEAVRYEGHVHQGGYLVSVHATDDESAERARRILVATEATDVSSKVESPAASRAESANARPAY